MLKYTKNKQKKLRIFRNQIMQRTPAMVGISAKENKNTNRSW